MRKIIIRSKDISVEAELNDTPTANDIYAQLPIESQVNTWGDEIYFSIPVVAEQELNAREIVSVGELGYWPVGKAFCIFFGPTPASTDERPRAYSPVNIIGQVLDDAKVFRKLHQGEKIKLIKVDAE